MQQRPILSQVKSKKKGKFTHLADLGGSSAKSMGDGEF